MTKNEGMEMKVKKEVVDEKARTAILTICNQLFGTMLSKDFIENIDAYLKSPKKK